MNRQKIVIAILALTLTVALVGCGSSEKPATPPPAAQAPATTTGHDSHGTSMPKEDPMPMMKDMDQQMQDIMKQIKGGQMMEAQKTAALLVSTTDKVMPHMMDNKLKEDLKKSAVDIKDTINSGKIDPTVMEGKMKAMQTIMKQTTEHLQTMKH